MYKIYKDLTINEKIIWIVILSIYIRSLFTNIMEIDAMQYAGISFQIFKNHSWLQIQEFDHDYLDKPPLLFWLSTLSYYLFGVNNFAYKFPAFICLILNLVYVYKYCLLFYNQKTGKIAALVLGTTQAFFLIVNDIRTDGILMSLVFISTYFLSKYYKELKLKYFIYASIGIALAMLVKGPIGFIGVLLPIGVDFILKKNWKEIFSIKWIFMIIIILIILSPMLWGLYNQFDLHREKTVYGLKGPSGLKFYFWTQSFGRITGENYWANDTPFYYFIQTILWDFFPWIIFVFQAYYFKIKLLFQKKSIENISIFSSLLLLFILSFSKYKLPHYAFISFPTMSIIVAFYINSLTSKKEIIYKKIATIFSYILPILFLIFSYLYYGKLNIYIVILILLHISFLIFRRKYIKKLYLHFTISFLSLNIFLAFIFYPDLIKYQATSEIGNFIKTEKINLPVFTYNKSSHSLNFYSRNLYHPKMENANKYKLPKEFYIVLDGGDIKNLNNNDFKIIDDKIFDDYSVTLLKLDFLNIKKRNDVLKKVHLIHIQKR